MPTIAWTIPAAEIANRRHSRDDRIFSEYSSTAEDFTDGVHCKPHAVETNEVISV
jgi:exoribonuclease R